MALKKREFTPESGNVDTYETAMPQSRTSLVVGLSREIVDSHCGVRSAPYERDVMILAIVKPSSFLDETVNSGPDIIHHHQVAILLQQGRKQTLWIGLRHAKSTRFLLLLLFIIILPNINKLMILADGERMLRVLFVVKSERM